MTTSIRRCDISFHEEIEEATFDRTATTTWTAAACGHLSTGEHLSMYRTGDTKIGAYDALKKALEGISVVIA